MSKEDALRLPYSQQFSPNKTPLKKLLPILRQNACKPSLKKSIAAAFFGGTADADGLASNTVLALRNYGIIDDKGGLTAFGTQLIALQGKEDDAHKLLAQHVLLSLNGIGLVETLREMERGGLPIDLTTIADELEHRGFTVNKSGSDLSGVLGWLRCAGVLDEYKINSAQYQVLVKASSSTLDATKELKAEQIAFLRAMLALNVADWTP